MNVRVIPVAAALVAALAACSGSHATTGSQQSAATQAASPQASAAQAAAPAQTAAAGAAAQSALPVYPGAVKMPEQMQRPIKMCGSRVSLTLYRVANVDADTVTKWYDARIGNAIRMSFHPDTGTTAATSQDEAIFSPDGSSSVVVMQMHLQSPKLAAAAKSIGADRTTIGLNSYDPPFSPDVIRAMQLASQGDGAAKAAARATVKAKCGDDFATVGG